MFVQEISGIETRVIYLETMTYLQHIFFFEKVESIMILSSKFERLRITKNNLKLKIMKPFKTFEEALSWQRENGSYEPNNELATGIINIDRVQFSLGDVFWIAMADSYYLDDYEESVTQYGFTASGEWAAVYGGHCSCYGWEKMVDDDITYYNSLEVLLKADDRADVINKYKDTINQVLPFLKI